MRGPRLLQGRRQGHDRKQMRAADCARQAISVAKLHIAGDKAMDASGSALVRLSQQDIEHDQGAVSQIRPIQVLSSGQQGFDQPAGGVFTGR